MFQYGGGFVQDRSIYEDVEIFAKMNYDKGTMSKEDYDTYRSLFEAMVMTPFFPHPDLVVYVEGELDEILSRIQERGRQMEMDTDIEYWKELHQRYEDWIRDFNHAPILRINIKDYDLVNDPESIDLILRKIGKVLGHTVMKSEL
jgi:deoxyadenosine/deoxycytidine kinase